MAGAGGSRFDSLPIARFSPSLAQRARVRARSLSLFHNPDINPMQLRGKCARVRRPEKRCGYPQFVCINLWVTAWMRAAGGALEENPKRWGNFRQRSPGEALPAGPWPALRARRQPVWALSFGQPMPNTEPSTMTENARNRTTPASRQPVNAASAVRKSASVPGHSEFRRQRQASLAFDRSCIGRRVNTARIGLPHHGSCPTMCVVTPSNA